MSKYMHYMRALGKVIQRPDMKMMLESCSCEEHKKIKSEQWQTYLSSRIEDLVEVSCCKRIEHPYLTYGVGSGARVPKLLQWDCVNNVCTVCGVDNKLQMKKCEILSNSDLVIDVLEWINAPRQGMKKGKQNTQLELGLQKVAVRDVVDRLRDALVVCRIHMAQYEWRDTMRKIDTIMSDKNLHRCIMTDFGATLDLSAAEKDNSSVDNHAVICIFFVNFNWRDVRFKRMLEGVGLVDDVTRVSDCEKWIFFGDTISAGKKNDHVFHNACLTYIIKYYDKQRVDSGLSPIPFNIVWTDNCPTQYRCRQNFYHVSNAANISSHKPVLIHKFAQKYKFKGSWDATGKLVKQKILQNELKYDRCSNAKDCYMKLTRDMTRDGSEKQTQKLLEYERTGDAKVVKNTTFTTMKTHIGYGTEHKQEYVAMTESEQCKHVVFTNREDVPDIKMIQGTMLISQVNGTKNTNGKSLMSARIPCSCPPCRLNVNEMAEKCEYKSERIIEEHAIIMKNNDTNSAENDPHGILQLTVASLKAELLNRGLSRTGLKHDLIARLVADLERNNWDTGINNESDATVTNSDIIPHAVLPRNLLDVTVVNGDTTHHANTILPPQLLGATVANGDTTATVINGDTAQFADTIIPPQSLDATVANGDTTPYNLLPHSNTMPRNFLHHVTVANGDTATPTHPPHFLDATVINGDTAQLLGATVVNGDTAPYHNTLHVTVANGDTATPTHPPHFLDATVINGDTAQLLGATVVNGDTAPRSHAVPIPLLTQFDFLTVKQLKEQLLVRRLKRVGNKAELVQRLKQYTYISGASTPSSNTVALAAPLRIAAASPPHRPPTRRPSSSAWIPKDGELK